MTAQTILGEVIYSSAIADATGQDPVTVSSDGDCPRTLLGLSCIAREYDCLCEQVARADIAVDKSAARAPVARLRVELRPLDRDWAPVRRSIELIGYQADYQVTAAATMTAGAVVVCSFDLYRPENASLRTYLVEA